MKITTMGIDAVEAHQFDRGPFQSCISIAFASGAGWDNDRPQALLSPLFREVLRVAFDDCAQYPGAKNSTVELTPGQAMTIVVFALAQHAAGRNLVIHCGAGMSRSVAIAAALASLFVWEWTNPRDVHNQTVYNLISEAAYLYGRTLDPPRGGANG